MTPALGQKIVPRWEWRTFSDLEAPAARLAALAPDQVHESDEVYLVTREGEHTVKVRDDLMDVKHLEEVDGDGLERWRPVMKEPFPLSDDDARALLAALGVSVPPLARDAYTLDELLREACDPDAVRSVAVHKRRVRFTFAGCSSELTDVRADDTPMRTFAVESEDPGRVLGALRELGLEGRANTSYPRMLRAVAGLGGPRSG